MTSWNSCNSPRSCSICPSVICLLSLDSPSSPPLYPETSASSLSSSMPPSSVKNASLLCCIPLFQQVYMKRAFSFLSLMHVNYMYLVCQPFVTLDKDLSIVFSGHQMILGVAPKPSCRFKIPADMHSHRTTSSVAFELYGGSLQLSLTCLPACFAFPVCTTQHCPSPTLSSSSSP